MCERLWYFTGLNTGSNHYAAGTRRTAYFDEQVDCMWRRESNIDRKLSNRRHLNVEQRYDGQSYPGRSRNLYSYLCEQLWHLTGFYADCDRNGQHAFSTNGSTKQDRTLRCRDRYAYSYLC